MKTINLLPKEEKVVDIKSIILNVILILLIITFTITILASVFLNDLKINLSGELGDYETVNMKLQNDVNKLEIYNQFEEKVTVKSELVDYLQKDEILWSEIIRKLGEIIPENVYLIYFDGNSKDFYDFFNKVSKGEEIEEEEKEIESFSIGGYAAGQTDVSKFVIEIKDIPVISDEVWIKNIIKAYVSEDDINAVSYTIDTFWDIEPYLEDIEKTDHAKDENVPEEDEELEELMPEE